jgi:hypothetical protein
MLDKYYFSIKKRYTKMFKIENILGIEHTGSFALRKYFHKTKVMINSTYGRTIKNEINDKINKR